MQRVTNTGRTLDATGVGDVMGGIAMMLVEAIGGAIAGGSALVGDATRTAARWRARLEQRHHLAGLDARLLDDIGVDPVAAHREVEKPFWRA
ncbi:MAG: DUF1127 domain-containing protein [Alphaproteobacteria bacterium]|nr:DUF1127 domain-containing protein [Alphaproteobacteria bacterium]